VLLVAVVPANAIAQPVPAGGEFAVNAYTSGLQFAPATCRTRDGGFVVAFQDVGLEPGMGLSDGRDGSGSAVVLRRFAADATPLGSEVIVNTYTTGEQIAPRVTCGHDGGFLVTWRDVDQLPDGGRDAIVARAYDTEGAAVGPAFRVDFGPYPQAPVPVEPSACTAGTDFVVVWSSSQRYVTARRFDAAGEPIGGSIEPEDAGVSEDGARCCGTDAGFTVIWHGFGGFSGGDGSDVFAQRFSSAGAQLGSAFLLNTYTLAEQRSPAVACGGSGDVVAAWTSDGGGFAQPQDGDGKGVYAQRLDADGAFAGTEIAVNAYTTGSQQAPDVAQDLAGRFVVTWQSPQPSSGEAIIARAFDAAGSPSGTELRVHPVVAQNRSYPVLAMRPSGDFAVVWQIASDGDSAGISARAFDFAGGATTTTSASSTTVLVTTTSFPATSTTAAQPTSSTMAETTTTVAGSTTTRSDASTTTVAETTTSTSVGVTTTTAGPAGECGDPVAFVAGASAGASLVTAADALYVLRAAVGAEPCAACVCDVDGNGAVTASDALRALRRAVGHTVELTCPPC
jgi:hypothetical protein